MDLCSRTHRIFYADILRVAATIAVITLHNSFPLLYAYKPDQSQWWVGDVLDSATRWAVPVFVMISGMILLGRHDKYSIAAFLNRRFLRVVVPFASWAFVYLLWDYRAHLHDLTARTVLSKVNNGEVAFHFWFIYMIIGIYAVAPIIHVFTAHARKSELHYFIVVWLATTALNPLLARSLHHTIGVLNFRYVAGFIGYFVLGHYLGTYDLPEAVNRLLYGSALLSFAVTIGGTYLGSERASALEVYFYDYLGPTVILMSSAVFLWFKRRRWQDVFPIGGRLRTALAACSAATYGVYLAHILVITWLDEGTLGFEVDTEHFLGTTIHPALGVPLVTVATSVICFGLVLLTRRIPVLRKLMA